MQHGGGRRPPRGAATPRIPLNIGWRYASLYYGFVLLYVSARGCGPRRSQHKTEESWRDSLGGLPLPAFSFLTLGAFAPVMGLCSCIRRPNSFTDKDASIKTTHGIYESSSGLGEDERTPA